jgi:hypothetical protein
VAELNGGLPNGQAHALVHVQVHILHAPIEAWEREGGGGSGGREEGRVGVRRAVQGLDPSAWRGEGLTKDLLQVGLPHVAGEAQHCDAARAPLRGGGGAAHPRPGCWKMRSWAGDSSGHLQVRDLL